MTSEFNYRKRGGRKPAPWLPETSNVAPVRIRKHYFAKVPPAQYVPQPRCVKTYFIQGDTTRLIKIGRTVGTAEERLQELQPYSPDILRVLKVVSRNIEIECHRKFQKWRIHGEWFLPDDELLLYIQQLT